MKTKLLLLTLALVGSSLNAHAVTSGRDGNGRVQEGRDGNGGADSGLIFRDLGAKAIAVVTSDPKSYPEVAGVNLGAILSAAEVLVVDQPLFVRKGDVVQESTAVNYRAAANCSPDAAVKGECRARDTILINGPRWDKLKNEFVKQALALHEVLGLAGIEGTGNYTVSSRFLQAMGIRCANGLCDFGIEARYGEMRFHSICLGAGRGKCLNPPVTAKDFDRYPVVGGGSCKTADHDFMDLFEEDEKNDSVVFKCNFVSIGHCARLSGRDVRDVGIGSDGRCYVIED